MFKQSEREIGRDWIWAGLLGHIKKLGLYQEGTWEPLKILSRGVTPVSGYDLYLERSPIFLRSGGNNTATKTS